ncbi:MAG: hypothetical protein K0R27_4151 [Xanthobacteraceae bacterium]|nr:hypothetical protein [Xanthobacteraceae bacterium]
MISGLADSSDVGSHRNPVLENEFAAEPAAHFEERYDTAGQVDSCVTCDAFRIGVTHQITHERDGHCYNIQAGVRPANALRSRSAN